MDANNGKLQYQLAYREDLFNKEILLKQEYYISFRIALMIIIQKVLHIISY